MKQDTKTAEQEAEELFAGKLNAKEVQDKIRILRNQPEVVEKYIRQAGEQQR